MTQPTTRNQKKAAIELGLHALITHAQPGQTLTAGDIAEVCGCTRNNIYEIEKKAIRKLTANPRAAILRDYIERDPANRPAFTFNHHQPAGV